MKKSINNCTTTIGIKGPPGVQGQTGAQGPQGIGNVQFAQPNVRSTLIGLNASLTSNPLTNIIVSSSQDLRVIRDGAGGYTISFGITYTNFPYVTASVQPLGTKNTLTAMGINLYDVTKTSVSIYTFDASTGNPLDAPFSLIIVGQ